jgi:homospermidine synthase
MGNDQFVPVESVTVKQLQKRLKIATNKVTVVDYNTRLAAQHFDTNDINIIRMQVKNAKLRNVFYRLINKDFYIELKC